MPQQQEKESHSPTLEEASPSSTHEETPTSERDIPETDPATIEERVLDLLLTDEAKATLEKKIKHYYQMKAKSLENMAADGVGYCVWCHGSFDVQNLATGSPQFKASYDPTTYCRTLEIVCPASPSCNKREKIVFGVVFHLEEMLCEQKKKLEELKHKIIINKNDLMFGYKDRKDAIAYHDTTVAQLKGITDTYASRLYKYLSYANNEKLSQEIEKLEREINSLAKEIQLFLSPAASSSLSAPSPFSFHLETEAIEAAVKAALHIREDYGSLHRMKEIQEKAYKEYLFNCESKFAEDEEEIVKEKKKKSREKTVIESSERKRERDKEKSGKVESKEEKKEKKMLEKIQKEITHLYDTYEIFDELLQNDAEYYEQTEKEIAELSKLLKRQGTEAQKKEFHDIQQMYLEKFIKMEEAKRQKEQEDKDRIQTMLTSGENDEELKKQLEEDMEEL
jgi:hypothetical protein